MKEMRILNICWFTKKITVTIKRKNYDKKLFQNRMAESYIA
jgi:hypothetical protein